MEDRDVIPYTRSSALPPLRTKYSIRTSSENSWCRDGLRVPVLAIYASPHSLPPWAKQHLSTRTKFEESLAAEQTATDAIADAFHRAIPTAQILKLKEREPFC